MTSLAPMAVEVEEIMVAIGLRPDSFFLGGSAGLALRGIRPIGDDIDVGITTAYWFYLYATSLRGQAPWRAFTPDQDDPRRRCDPPYLFTEVNGKQVHLFFAWRNRGKEETEFNDFNLVFREGIEEVRGWPCLKLDLLLRQKVDALRSPPIRAKDLADVRLISAYLDGVRRARATA